jgi:hypothetical protein
MVSFGTRVSATVVVGALWFAFIMLYLAFYAGTLDFWQKAAVFLASMAIAGAAIAVFWIRWAIPGEPHVRTNVSDLSLPA